MRLLCINLSLGDSDIKLLITSTLAVLLAGCATLTSDAMTPIMVGFSDGSEGTCTFTNKRGGWSGSIPGTIRVRRSDDSLRYSCKTDDGRTASGATVSEYGSKHMASVIFLDLGITDAITDKHRTYAASLTIPVSKIKTPNPPEKSVSTVSDTYEDLKKLNDLKEKNIISQEEFDAEKKKILDN